MDFPKLLDCLEPIHNTVRVSNTFTTKKNVSQLPLPVVPAGRMKLNTFLYIMAAGDYSSLTGAALTLGFWFGTRAEAITGDIALSSVITTGTTPAAWPWEMQWMGWLNTDPGTTATLIGQGNLIYGSSLTAYNAAVPIPITAALRTTGAFDTTIDRAIGVSATWGASSASNQITVNYTRAVCFN